MNTEHTVSAAAQAQVKVVRNLLPSDARYDGLRFVVQMECVHDGRFHWDYPLEHRGFTCEECGAKGVNFPPRSTKPRNWTLPRGSLQGSIHNLSAQEDDFKLWGSYYQAEYEWRVAEMKEAGTVDRDLAACEAVEAALKAQKGTAT